MKNYFTNSGTVIATSAAEDDQEIEFIVVYTGSVLTASYFLFYR